MAPRIEVEDVHQKLESGQNTLLVCGYDSDEKFRKYHLEGAISLKDFHTMEQSLEKDREIVFYCD